MAHKRIAYWMAFVFDVCGVSDLRSKTRYVKFEVSCVIDLENGIPQTSRTLLSTLAFERTYTETIAKEESLVEGS